MSLEILSYASCSTCKKALAWLADRGVPHTVRPIVTSPPTLEDLAVWMPASGVAPERWLNTSGQSYRALGGKAHFGGMDADGIARALAADGKLVKRPVAIRQTSGKLEVLVGFDAARWGATLG